MSEVTRLWSPTRMLTVRQTLEDALAEVDEFVLERIIIIGTYKNGSLMVKPSRITHEQANWLLDRAKHDLLRDPLEADDNDD